MSHIELPKTLIERALVKKGDTVTVEVKYLQQMQALKVAGFEIEPGYPMTGGEVRRWRMTAPRATALAAVGKGSEVDLGEEPGAE